MSAPHILIALLNYRTPDMTIRAAETALRETASLQTEMIIVDNGSGDDSYAKIAQTAQVRGWTRDHRVRVLGTGRNGGFGAGNNFAFQQGLSDGTAPDYIYLLNSDAFLDPGALQTLLAFMEAHPKAGFAGSQLHGEHGDLHTVHFRFPTIASEFEQAIKFGPVTRLLQNKMVPMPATDRPVQADWVAGASLLIRWAVLDQIGTFDEGFFLYFEETDLCRRARAAGWDTWLVPESTVMHIGSVSTGMKTWRRTPDYWFDSRRRYFLKHHGRAYLIGASLARITGGALWRLRCALTGRRIEEPRWFLSDFIRHAIRAYLPKRSKTKDPTRRAHYAPQTGAKDIR